MKHNIRITIFMVFLSLSFWSSITWADQDTIDSSDVVIAEDGSQTETPSPYTLVEFDQLTDEEKRQIYFNVPQLLPDDFQADQYHDIMHQQ